MGTVCGHEKSPKMKLIAPQNKTDVPETQATHALPQSQVTFGSQLEDLSATLRSIPYKIPISKSDIRKFYKFQKTIGIFIFPTPTDDFYLFWLILSAKGVYEFFHSLFTFLRYLPEKSRTNPFFFLFLGYGTFGKVYLANKIEDPATGALSSQPFAVKVMRDFRQNERLFKVASREISIMRALDHPNIIKLIEAYEDEKHLSLVLEYCSGGELLDYVLARHHLTELEAAHFMENILTSIDYLHKNRISHRDLKLQNFMFDKKGEDGVLKLIDFGLSAQYTAEENRFTTIVGSPLYIAPEILAKKPYDFSCDLWSCGVILYLLLSGSPPFKGTSNHEIFNNIMEGNFDLENGVWEEVSKEAKSLIRGLLKVDPKDRMAIEKALVHPWFNKMLSAHLIQSPLREFVEGSMEIGGLHRGHQVNIFKEFDKDSSNQSFSLENMSDGMESKRDSDREKDRKKTKSSLFKKMGHEGDIEFEAFDEKININLGHLV